MAAINAFKPLSSFVCYFLRRNKPPAKQRHSFIYVYVSQFFSFNTKNTSIKHDGRRLKTAIKLGQPQQPRHTNTYTRGGSGNPNRVPSGGEVRHIINSASLELSSLGAHIPQSSPIPSPQWDERWTSPPALSAHWVKSRPSELR